MEIRGIAMERSIPELVCPAGSLDKLKIAVLYGADAVYLAGENFGLRAACDNFTDWEIAQGVLFAHSHGVKVYITLNGFLHDDDLLKLPSFIDFLSERGVDGVILSDPGVLQVVRK
ncbi:MAG: U32 family peptidase, partial [Halobacteriovoraceae bacterium]|nr:U32 family peptidase [Halobacteriovoraceae bacterium]